MNSDTHIPRICAKALPRAMSCGDSFTVTAAVNLSATGGVLQSLFGKLWPDQVPVGGAQVAAGDCTTGGALDGDAQDGVWTTFCVAVLPLANLCIAFDTNGFAQLAH